MKFLCLHGAIGSSKNFSVQLAPLEEELKQTQASFQFIDGPRQVEAPKDFPDYFGIGPLYRWILDEGEENHAIFDRVRAMPDGASPEDVMRRLLGPDEVPVSEAAYWKWRNVLDSLYKTIDEDPEIQGIIGYSEGACVAATFVLEEMIRYQESGRPRKIHCAMFLFGWPPMGSNGTLVLSDESDLVIDIPTLHVIGANDPYKNGSLALYNVCDSNSAELFDTGKGHTVPRAGMVLEELASAVQILMTNGQDFATSQAKELASKNVGDLGEVSATQEPHAVPVIPDASEAVVDLGHYATNGSAIHASEEGAISVA